ncbi:MAG: putative Ig domain-containing protein, partial [Deltaproteobacteria bacterium]|nr:putative Ig domain-containing protein [Deltaproteobacteria bacterium]
MTKDFDATLGSGILNGVPAGDNRVLTMQGINSSDEAIFEGTSSNISVYPGQTSNAGTILMGAINPGTGVPGPVTGFTATAGNGSVTLTWSNPGDAEFAGVRIVRSSDGSYPASPLDGDLVYDGKATSHTDSTVTNETTYHYAAYAYSSNPYYSTAAKVSTTPSASDTSAPGDVTNFTATAENGQITFTWTNPGETDYSGVMIRRSTVSYPTSGSGLEVYNDIGESYTDTGLSNGTTYYYSAFAHDAVPNFATGVQVEATPLFNTPAGLAVAVVAAGNALTITWNTVTGATGYNLYRGTASGVTQLTGTQISDASSPHTDYSLVNGTEYFYVVTALDATSESLDSTQASGIPADTVAPGAPTIDPVTSPANEVSQDISGTKEANTSIWINGAEAVTLDGQTTWTATVYFTNDGTSGGTPADGTYDYSFTAKDASGNESGPATTSIIGNPVNDAPVISGLPSSTATEDTEYTDTNISSTDVDAGDTSSYSISGPSWLGIDPDTGALSGTPLNAHVGDNNFTVTVKDALNATDTLDFTINVSNTNDAPSLSGAPTPTATEDTEYTDSNISSVDDDVGDTKTFSISGPAWLGINASTGVLIGTPLNTHVGDNSFTVTVKDGSNATDTVDFIINVSNTNDVPTISGAPDTTGATGTAYIFTPGGGDDDVTIGIDTLEYSIFNKPGWASFDTASGTLSGTPTDADIPAIGNGIFSGIDICVTDNVIATPVCLGAFTITVADATAPSPATDLATWDEDNAVDLSWVNSVSADQDGVVIMRRDDGVFPTGVNDAQAEQVVDTLLEGAVDAGLAAGTYHYAAFAKDEVPNYSPAVT